KHVLRHRIHHLLHVPDTQMDGRIGLHQILEGFHIQNRKWWLVRVCEVKFVRFSCRTRGCFNIRNQVAHSTLHQCDSSCLTDVLCSLSTENASGDKQFFP